MSKMSILVLLALATCLVPEATAACSYNQLENLEKQLEMCCRGLPAMQFDGYSQWARAVTSRMRQESTCNLEEAPLYFQSVLRGRGYIGRDDINKAVTCIRNAITYGICC